MKKKTGIQSLVDNVYGWDYDGIWSSSIPQLSFLINENIFVKCFRTSSSFRNPRISPLTIKYESPQLFLLNNTTLFPKQQVAPLSDEPYQVGNTYATCNIIPCSKYTKRNRLFETFYFLQSNTWKSLNNRPSYLPKETKQRIINWNSLSDEKKWLCSNKERNKRLFYLKSSLVRKIIANKT